MGRNDEHKRVNVTKGNQILSKTTYPFCHIQIPFYRNESREVLARSCFASVYFFDSIWRLLTFIRWEDETKINDLSMTFRRRVYGAVMVTLKLICTWSASVFKSSL